MRTLIKNGTCVTASDTFAADLLMENGKISALLLPGTPVANADRVIDAAGKYVIPGGIDAHTHLDMPFGGTSSIDDFESGTVAAAHGGTTCLIDFAIQKKGGTLREALDTWHQKAEGKAAVDYAFHMIATDLPPARLEDYRVRRQAEAVRRAIEPVCSMRFFTSGISMVLRAASLILATTSLGRFFGPRMP